MSRTDIAILDREAYARYLSERNLAGLEQLKELQTQKSESITPPPPTPNYSGFPYSWLATFMAGTVLGAVALALGIS